ncbi:MAG TPA: glycosyltransferase family 4 protein, partial [Ferruginibacter sp.]|nr:glycosyltransferase family 4 protein [Ferruginibacter sp.]
MKVAFIVRSTLFTVKGGDTIQVKETARQLREYGVEVDILTASEKINYDQYNLLHFFNIIRPADILVHVKRSGKPFVVSTILVDYAAYDKQQRPGLAGKLFSLLPAGRIEYLKTIYRSLRRQDPLVSIAYLWKGHKRSIREILSKAKAVFVHAQEEYRELVKLYGVAPPYTVIRNGIDKTLFQPSAPANKEQDLVLCVARIEGIKNQYNLIRAINNSAYRLVLIGDVAPNQREYYRECRKIAAENISFVSHLPQNELLEYYAAAKVHVLPSFFEVCGLASLEAAAMGCRIVITDKGYARSYFNDAAFYCDPKDPDNILQAIDDAASANINGE